MRPLLRTCVLLWGCIGLCGHVAAATPLLSADFDLDEDGFQYCDDPFLGTTLPDYAAGARIAAGGYGNSGALQTTLGGVGAAQAVGASGGWCVSTDLSAPADDVAISFRYKLQIDPAHVSDEYARVLVSLDGTLLGRGAKSYVDHLGGTATQIGIFHPDTDWQQVTIAAGNLSAGPHRWRIGAYNNKSQAAEAKTVLLIDDVVVSRDQPTPPPGAPRILVERLNLDRFKADVESIASFGDRDATSPRFATAQAWVARRLEALGYTVEYHVHPLANPASRPVSNLYVTKVGVTQPDRMYIVSAHLDGSGEGGGADDDGSGVALLLEIARVLAAADVQTGISIRLIFWDYEEWGLAGSRAYVQDRRALQGIENPKGSGVYPEPTWLGVLQHDMLLYDHGPYPPSDAQSPFADLDVEWYWAAAKAEESRKLALLWHHWNGEYAARYPSTAYNRSSSTDDRSFRDLVASISVRENRRDDGNEWVNPHYHASTDVYASYSQEDFELGFNAVQATLGTVATLADARMDDTLFRDGFEAGAAAPKRRARSR